MQCNGVNLHPHVSCGPLIEDQWTDLMTTPKFSLFVLSFFDGVKHSWIFN